MTERMICYHYDPLTREKSEPGANVLPGPRYNPGCFASGVFEICSTPNANRGMGSMVVDDGETVNQIRMVQHPPMVATRDSVYGHATTRTRR